MGILREPADYVRQLKLPKGFSVCELGDQYITHEAPHYLAKKFYQDLGCGRYLAIDANGRGDLTHDLNLPLKKDLGLFDLVTDFGTGEHIFNQFQVWKTIHILTKVNGFIVFDRPAQGYQVHCFYLVNECVFKDLAAANDYELRKLERVTTPRGELLRGVFRKRRDRKFQIPQQGRYQKDLKP